MIGLDPPRLFFRRPYAEDVPLTGWVLELFYKLFHKSKKEAQAAIQRQELRAGRPSDVAARRRAFS